MFTIDKKMIMTDADGYLLSMQDWSEAVALRIAAQENIIMTATHWDIINFARQFYQQFQLSPSMRLLLKGLEKRSVSVTQSLPTINSRMLYTLFSGSPALNIAKIAGLPKPTNCI